MDDREFDDALVEYAQSEDTNAVDNLNARFEQIVFRMELLTAVFGGLIVLLLFAVFYTRWWAARGRDIPRDQPEATTRKRVKMMPPTDGTPVVEPIAESDDNVEKVSTELSTQSTLRRRTRRDASLSNRIYRFVGGSADSSGTSTSEGSPSASPKVGHSPTRAIRRNLNRRHSVSSTASYAVGRAKKWLTGEEENRERQRLVELGRKMPQPPAAFFEPDRFNVQVPTHLSPEIFYVLHHLKSLELPEKWILNPSDIDVQTYEANEYVFKPDCADQYLYVVIDGCLSVNILDTESRKEYPIKQVNNGEAVFSLLSVLDVMAGMESIFRTVSATATVKTTVAKFREAFHRDPAAWIRPVQIVITRLMHVTLTTCHHYLGLSLELTKPTLEPPSEHARARHQSGLMPGGIQRRRRLSGGDDVKTLQTTAVRKFAQALELASKDYSLLESRIKLESYSENSTILEQGEKKANLYLVLSGSIRLVQKSGLSDHNGEEGEEITTGLVLGDELIGGLQMLTGEPAFYTLKTRSAVRVAYIDTVDFYSLMDTRPAIILPVCKSVLSRLSAFLRGIDFAIDWRMVDTGQALYRQDDVADCLHVVLSGRLRSVIGCSAEKKAAVEEFGRGDLVGMVEVLLKKPRTTTVMAVRFSQMATVPSGLLDYIKLKFPEVGFRMISLLGNYYTNYHRRFSNEPLSHVRNLHTIAVLPASRNVPLVPFTCELYNALHAYKPVLRLSSHMAAEHLGADTVLKECDFRMIHWLNAQEDTYPLVIYECDYDFTMWTRRCLHQADALLVVCNGMDDPDYGFLEQQIETLPESERTNRELVFLWPPNTENPHGTVDWIKTRGWFSGHHHLRCPRRMYQWSPSDLLKASTRKSTPESTRYGGPRGPEEAAVIEYYESCVYGQPIDVHSHFARLARRLTGNSIGLVLGGGGARGAAHVGIMKAMYEAGVPVDIVAGVSIGAFIGGIYCGTQQPDTVSKRAKGWFMHMTSFWKKLIDLTYHHSAIFSGSTFNAGIRDVFETREIDDLWIPYFCVSTDISMHQMRVHKTGSLWHYVRASMSLAGYLPPLCDPTDGHLLLDGGYVNNLPADVMWPWAAPMRILDMQEIQNRLAYVSCVRQLEQVKKAAYCRYIRPPIDEYKTLDFGKFDEIHAIGYEHGRDVFRELLRSDDKLYSILHPGSAGDQKQTSRSTNIIRKLRAHSEGEDVVPSFATLVATPSLAQRMASVDDPISTSAANRAPPLHAMSFSDLANAVSRLPIGMRQFVTDRRQKTYDMLDELPDGVSVWDTDEESISEDGHHSSGRLSSAGMHMMPPTSMSRQTSRNASEMGSRLHSPRLSIDDPRMLMTQEDKRSTASSDDALKALQDISAVAEREQLAERAAKDLTPSEQEKKIDKSDDSSTSG